MVSSPTAAAQEYKLTLDELVNNNKTQINLLTILAEDYLQYASYIVDTIEKQIYTVPKEQKLPILYVTDSILKNVPQETYKALFQKIIIKIFLHVFVNGDEKVRMSLYKLRQTWANNIFPASCLYKMDMEVNKEDKQWPISSPKGGPAPPPAAIVKPQVAVSPAIHFNPKFLQKPGNGNADPRRPRATVEPVKKVEVIKKEPPSDPQQPRDVLDNIMSLPNSRPVKEEPEEPIPPKKISPVPPKRRGFEDSRAPPKKKRSPLPRDEDLRRRGGPIVNHNVSNNRVPSPSVPAAPATALPGAHAFAVAPVIAAGPSGSPNINSPAFTEGFPSSSQFSATPAFTPMPPSTSSAFYPPPVASAPIPPPAPTPVPSRPVEISDGEIKLEGIPANNRIFVDGKAHEVFYINDDTAVIERNGLPHRIYFAGPPRNVIIDGVAYMLHFGERKTVYIDGQPHVLRFGAPSKELYMGNYAFKGQFGGAPIIAIIDNVRHEIRLCGPAPEVKIEPEPAYDLTRFMPQLRDGRPEPPKPTKPAENPFDLLRRLQLSGFLNKNNEEKPKDGKKAPAKERTPPPIPSEHTFDLVERRAEPGTSLRDFNMRLLKIRYTAIVDALHEKQRNACPQCGLRMELSGEKYSRHLDWHVKRNLQTLERTSTSRPWYSNGKDWLGNEEDEIPGTSNTEEIKVEVEEPSSAISSKDAPNSDCGVCSEKFKEYYDEHDEIWKFKDTVVVGGMIVHVGCVQDVSMLEPSAVSCASASDPDFVVEEKTLKIVPSH